MSPVNYFTCVFTWMKEKKKNPRHINPSFFGTESSEEIALRYSRKAHQKNPSRQQAPQPSSFNDRVLADIKTSAMLVHQWSGLLKDSHLVKTMYQSNLSPYYLALDPEYNTYKDRIDPNIQQAVWAAWVYLERNTDLKLTATNAITA